MMNKAKVTTSLLCLTLTVSGFCCSRYVKDNPNVDMEAWNKRPPIISTLSGAILNGIRHLLDELLLTESWFIDTEVSIFTKGVEVLRGKITDFRLQEMPTAQLFCRVRLHVASTKNVEYVNAVNFFETTTGSADSLSNLSVRPDSLFMDVFATSPKLLATAGESLSTIRVTYWRDVTRKDAIVTVEMHMTESKRFEIAYPPVVQEN